MGTLKGNERRVNLGTFFATISCVFLQFRRSRLFSTYAFPRNCRIPFFRSPSAHRISGEGCATMLTDLSINWPQGRRRTRAAVSSDQRLSARTSPSLPRTSATTSPIWLRVSRNLRWPTGSILRSPATWCARSRRGMSRPKRGSSGSPDRQLLPILPSVPSISLPMFARCMNHSISVRAKKSGRAGEAEQNRAGGVSALATSAASDE